MNWFAYCYDNPINFIDLTGLSTEIDSDGNVVSVYNDNDFGIYQYNGDGMGPPAPVGQTYYWDTFSVGDQVHVGVDKTKEVIKLAKEAKGESPYDVAMESRDGQKYDVTSQWGYAATDGFLLFGKYCTVRDIGNALAGINAAELGISYEAFQRMAGALHQGQGKLGIIQAFYGREYGPPPTYGEVMVQYRMSMLGYYYFYYLTNKRR